MSSANDANSSLHLAREAYAAGLSVIPVKNDGTKSPACAWKKFQVERAGVEQMRAWFPDDHQIHGVGVVTGTASGGLMCLDFDVPELFEQFMEIAQATGLGPLVDKVAAGWSDETPSRGVHLFWQCDDPFGNVKLAESPERETEIETRGNGGFAVLDCVHPDGRPYKRLQGGPGSVERISRDEQESIFQIARSFNRHQRPAIEPPSSNSERATTGDRPGDVYARSTDHRQLLESHGWTLVYARGSDEYWRRPGKSHGISAVYHCETRLLVVFSTSTAFETERGYGPFSVYTMLNHNGDYAASARDLAQQGYGERSIIQATRRDSSAPDDLADESEASTKRGRRSNADKAVELILDSGAELWKTPNGDPFMSIEVNGHVENIPINSKACTELVGHLFYSAFSTVPGAQSLKDAASTLGGKARYEGKTHRIFTRIGHSANCIYIDLGTPDRAAVKINGEGWLVVESADVPIKFKRPLSLLPLPKPVSGRSLDQLGHLFGLDGHEWRLIVGFLVGCFQPYGARAFLEITGQQGSGKTTLARLLVSLADPAEVPLRSAPKDEEALIIAGINRSIQAFDNVSVLSHEMADAYCRTATGGGIGKRQLYSDAEEIVLRLQMSLLWTAINSVSATYPDLQDRTLSVTMPALSSADRLSETQIEARFAELYPELLGSLYGALACALKNLPGADQIESLPRLADFAQWVEAAAPALGWEDGEFIAAYESAHVRSSQLTIEGSVIGDLIVLMTHEKSRWDVTAGELLEELRIRADEDRRRQKAFPKQPNQLSRLLNRIQGALRDIGVEITFEKERDRRSIIIERSPVSLPEHRVDGESTSGYICVEEGCTSKVSTGNAYYCAIHAGKVAA
jgi:energy-coupling factor transporter ATP-binding protein EcfA2